MTVLPLYALQDRHEPLHGFRIIVVEEQALAAIEGFDRRHILCRQCEVKEVKVLLHPVLVRGLGDHDNITLEQEAQGGLCGGFTVPLQEIDNAPHAQASIWQPYFLRYSLAVFCC